ncbi:MAG: hypothetical protein WCO56_03245 [Verrucomicrobiota bacterium]
MTRSLNKIWVWLLLTALATSHARAAEYKKTAGPFEVGVFKAAWQDTNRTRELPVKIYYPNTNGLFPVIIFSHGLGGSRDGYEYVGRHWASHGYVCVHLQHAGSDDGVWRGKAGGMAGMRAAAADPRNAIARPVDVTFALDQLAKLAVEPGPLEKHLDTNRIGMAGHSFGANTTLTTVGQRFGVAEYKYQEPRIKAAIAMSAPVPRLNAERSYDRITVPVYHLTGTKDDSPIGDTKPEQRRFPFDHITGADQYLLILAGGDHMVFSGRSGLLGLRSKDAVFHELILMSTTAFWDAHLKGDAAAKQWIEDGGFKSALGEEGTFEIKRRQ